MYQVLELAVKNLKRVIHKYAPRLKGKDRVNEKLAIFSIDMKTMKRESNRKI